MQPLKATALGWWFASSVLIAGWPHQSSAADGTYTQLYGFTGGADGAVPFSSLIADQAGNGFGTTSEGGDICADSPYDGCGTIFKTDLSGHLKTIYTFQGGADGVSPHTSVTLAHGTLFGGASGGTSAAGVLFSVKTDGSDFSVMHEFTGADGYGLRGFLQPVSNGGYFGVTEQGGPDYKPPSSYGQGVLFFVRPNGVYDLAHRFGGEDGREPNALLSDSSGNLFGSTFLGGGCEAKSGCGTIFEYTPATRTFSVLYTFQGLSDGASPILGGVGANGILYGATTHDGGNGHGTLFSLTPTGKAYSFATLASFESRIDGDAPQAGPTLAHDGSLVGSTLSYIYRYYDGKLSAPLVYGVGNVPFLNPQAPLSVARDDVIYGTSYSGGVGPCKFSNGLQIESCGIIFSFTP